jgi:hypothetical protein
MHNSDLLASVILKYIFYGTILFIYFPIISDVIYVAFIIKLDAVTLFDNLFELVFVDHDIFYFIIIHFESFSFLVLILFIFAFFIMIIF